MPSNWLAMDDNFPTFTGEESPQQQIAALHNYLFQMREGLQYSMRNLTAENFNEAALQQLTDEQKNSVAEELQKLRNTITSFSNEISSLSARVSSIENLGGRMNEAESAITWLEEDAETKDATLKEHEESIAQLEKTTGELQEQQADFEEQLGTAQGDIDGLQTDVDALNETVGGEGGVLERTTALEDTVAGEAGLTERTAVLEETVTGEGGLEERTEALENALAGEGGIEEQLQGIQQEQEKMSGVVQVAEDGSATLGGEEKTVYLVGKIYINGQLFESGGEAI